MKTLEIYPGPHSDARILDTDLALLLGMNRLSHIRRNITRHMREMREHGEVCTRKVQTSKLGGRPTTAYLLTEGQAVLLCILAKGRKAEEARKIVIDTFLSVRNPTPPLPAPIDKPKWDSELTLKDSSVDGMCELSAFVPWSTAFLMAKVYRISG